MGFIYILHCIFYLINTVYLLSSFSCISCTHGSNSTSPFGITTAIIALGSFHLPFHLFSVFFLLFAVFFVIFDALCLFICVYFFSSFLQFYYLAKQTTNVVSELYVAWSLVISVSTCIYVRFIAFYHCYIGSCNAHLFHRHLSASRTLSLSLYSSSSSWGPTHTQFCARLCYALCATLRIETECNSIELNSICELGKLAKEQKRKIKRQNEIMTAVIRISHTFKLKW